MDDRLIEELNSGKNYATEFMKKYLIDLVVAVALIVYVFKAIATVGIADKSIIGILGDGALAFVFANLIAELLRKQGLLSGKSNSSYIATMREYGKVIDEVTPYIEKLDNWCDKANEKNAVAVITQTLSTYGISYNRFASGIQSPTDMEKKVLNKVAKLKLHKCCTYELMSEVDDKGERFSLGMTTQQYLKKASFSGTIIAIVCALIFSYFTLTPITVFSTGALVWAIAQAAFFLIKGVTAFFQAYMFITDNHRNRIILKTNLLYEFKNEIEKENKEILKNEQLQLQSVREGKEPIGRHTQPLSATQAQADTTVSGAKATSTADLRTAQTDGATQADNSNYLRTAQAEGEPELHSADLQSTLAVCPKPTNT